MKMVIGQPRLEKGIGQLEQEVMHHPEADVFFFPEGYLNQNLEAACRLARTHGKILITGYKNPRDRMVIIDRQGSIVLDKAKYDPLSIVELEGMRIGHMLCDELVWQGLGDSGANAMDLVVHPIGVGMFSEEQLEEWLGEARKQAQMHHTVILGTSHADGSFRDSDITIPLAYGIDRTGELLFLRKNDVRTVVFDTETLTLEAAEETSYT